MRKFLAIGVLGLLAACLGSPAFAGPNSLTVNWTRPPTYTDGTALPITDLSGYRITCAWTPAGSTTQGACPSASFPSIPGGSATVTGTVTVPATGGKVCVKVIAQATSAFTGNVMAESDPSNEACKDIAAVLLKPGAPTVTSIVVVIQVGGQ